ncbi:MAG TPA: hypothetical protein VEB59_05515, partial [Gemmatimonadales bacterium]|nr:hypothetical protein [Gemmatimonadales bacterium]
MSHFPRARTLACGTALACCVALAPLTACNDEVPVGPGTSGVDTGDPALAIGFYGLAAAPTGPVGRPCTRPEYRQFDFWIGNWDVDLFGGGGPSGSNIITRELDGCLVEEDYANGGYVGRSLNTYDAADGRWHQHWMANDGLPLIPEGGFNGESMVMQGVRPSPTGPVLDRIAWTALAPDRVRQFWDTSLDGGETFSISFDGDYRRDASVTQESQDPAVPTVGCQNQAIPGYFLFDFTLGEWTVAPEGAHRTVPALQSTISHDLSDCLIEERISGRAGYEARVFNTMRRRTGEWLRTFIDNRGIR